MVDVGDKPRTRRVAVARGEVVLSPAAFDALVSGALAKGDALAVARIAGIQAAKRTSEIVPLCHPVPLDAVSVDAAPGKRTGTVVVTARAATHAKTGVEMEALTAVAAACLALYDMVKGIDRASRIEGIALVEKSGGRSGRFVAPPSPVRTAGKRRG